MEVGRALTAYSLPLDPSVRSLYEFCNSDQHRGKSDEQLAQHITQVRDKAFAIAPWPCLGWFNFMPPPIRKAGTEGTYTRIVDHLRQNRDAKILDLGCCFAHDARALVQDGVEPGQIVNADLLAELMELGFELFQDSRDSPHIQGMRFEMTDVFNEDDIRRLQVPGGYHAIYAGSFVHLFPLGEAGRSPSSATTFCNGRRSSCLFSLPHTEQQEKCVAVLDRLLSKAPGSTIFGKQVGRPTGEEGVRDEDGFDRGPTGVPVDDKTGGRRGVYVHSTSSLAALFQRTGNNTTDSGWEARVDEVEIPRKAGDGVRLFNLERASSIPRHGLKFAMVRM